MTRHSNHNELNLVTRPAGTTISVKRSFQMLEDIERQDVFRWKEEFMQTAKLASWTDEVALQVMRESVDAKYFTLLDKATSLPTAFEVILKNKYPQKNYLKYLNQISNIHQDQFLTIKEYRNFIEDTVTRLGICMNWTTEQCEFKMYEAFFYGLAKRTQIEMARLNIKEISEMYNVINSTEESLLDQGPNFDEIINNKNKQEKSSHEIKKDTLTCSYHGKCNHRTEDCRELKKNKNDNHGQKDSKRNMSITERKIHHKTIELTGNINGHPHKVIFDTGSNNSYISSKIVEKEQLTPYHIKPSEARLVNNSSITTDNEVYISFTLENCKNFVYSERLKVLSEMDDFIILGVDFMTRYNVKIDMENMIIEIGDIKFELPKINQNYEIEEELDKKLMIMKISETSLAQDINKLLTINKLIEPIGLINGFHHEIKLTKDEIIRRPSYRMPLNMRERVWSEIQKLEENKILRPSNSSYCSPCFPILKKNGDIRLVIDYRQLNKITEADYYIFPKISDIFNKLHGMKYFSKIDLKSGYYQILMSEPSIKYTAFVIENKKFEWLIMPFGLTNAPKTFQRIMDQIFEKETNVIPYLDDIIIFSNTVEEHQNYLRNTLKRLNDYNIKINYEKSEFIKAKIIFLGHSISENGIAPVTDGLRNKLTFTPKTKRDLQKLLGYFNYYRNFIPNFSERTLYLTDKIGSKGKIVWDKKEKEKTENLLKYLESVAPLKVPDPTKPISLYTDASDRAVGSSIKLDNDIIGHYSHKLSRSEINYTTMEKEALGMIKAIQYFRSIIINNKVIIYTDNKNLIYEKDLSNRVQRWKLLLEEYNYELKQIKGADNTMADFLSRLNFVNTETENITIGELFKNLLSKFIKENDDIKNLRDEALMRYDLNKCNISYEKAYQIINNFHEGLGHPGAAKLWYTLKKQIKVKRLKQIVTDVTSKCEKCQRNKRRFTKLGHFGSQIVSDKPFSYISSDILGPIKTKHFLSNSPKEYFYLLSITDIFTRFTRIYYIEDITSASVIKNFKKWFESYPLPSKVLTDNGRQYISQAFKNLLDKYAIKHIQTSPHNPTANGISERINSTIKNVLRINKGESIKNAIKSAEINLNFTYNRNTKFIPIECIDSIFKRNDDENLEMTKNLEKEKKNKELDTFKKNKYRQQSFIKDEEKVLVRTHNPDKIMDLYEGPYKAIKVNYSNGYAMIDKGGSISRQNLKNLIPFMEGGGCGKPTDVEYKTIQRRLWKFLEKITYLRKNHQNLHDSASSTN
ncbi:Transposon Tf2-9 polyprotein [Dictyocoela muelleri]|nr:Transposon Tf2-9 polyprotein [Dictyocoela muelleri]